MNALPPPTGRSVAGVPQVTVIVRVFGPLAYTLNCLHSLLRQSSRYSFEVLVVDHSSDASSDCLKQITGVRYLRSRRNTGFLESSSLIEAAPRSEFIVLLDNNTRVLPGWLDELSVPLRSGLGLALSAASSPVRMGACRRPAASSGETDRRGTMAAATTPTCASTTTRARSTFARLRQSLCHVSCGTN